MSYWQLLKRNPEFSRLWLAQVISLTGDWFDMVVLSAMVARYSNGSALAISVFLLARVLPPLLFSSYAGVLVDRYNRKTILVWSNILRAGIVPLFLLADSPDKLWIIYGVAFIQFTLSSVFEPGQSAIVPALVERDDLIEANTLVSVTWSVMLAAGAAIGGFFASAFGSSAAILADSGTFLIAGLLLMSMKYKRGRVADDTETREKAKHEDTSFREGLRYVRRTPAIAAALFVKFGVSMGNIDTMLTIFATQIFILGTDGQLSIAILYSVFGAGAFLGPLILNRVNDGSVKRMRRLIGFGFICTVIGWVFLGASSTMLILAVGLFIRAVGGSTNWTYSNVIIQKTAPDAKLGRMFSLDMIGFYLASVSSTIVHGALIDQVGSGQVRIIALGTGVVSLIPLSLWFWMVTRLEKQDAEVEAANFVTIGD